MRPLEALLRRFLAADSPYATDVRSEGPAGDRVSADLSPTTAVIQGGPGDLPEAPTTSVAANDELNFEDA